MIKIILIDDDLIVIDILKSSINWEELGFELIGTFSDGRSASEFLKHENVDVVITDIRMPTLDGLQLIELCSKEFPHTQFVIISAYRDFSYAQKALKYGNVSGYLTKPLDFGAFSEVLDRVKGSFTQHYLHNKFNSLEDTNKRISLFSDLLCGLIKDTSELCNQFSQIGINGNYSSFTYSLVTVHIENFFEYVKNKWNHESTGFYYAINNLVEFENEDAYISLARYSFGNLDWIVIHKNKKIDIAVETFSEKLIENISGIFDLNAKITSCLHYKNLFDILNNKTYIIESDDKGPLPNPIDSAIEYIKENYAKNITLDTVSKFVFMSSSYFSAYFKKATEKKFIDYLTEIRMKKASELLKNTSYSVQTICQMVGYQHTGHFYDIFKKYFNATPAEYCDRFRKR